MHNHLHSVRKNSSKMNYANRKLEAILTVVDRALFEHFCGEEQINSRTERVKKAQELLINMDQKYLKCTMERSKLDRCTIGHGQYKAKIACVLSPFIFLMLSEKFLIPHLYTSGIRSYLNEWKTELNSRLEISHSYFSIIQRAFQNDKFRLPLIDDRRNEVQILEET